MRFIVAPYRCSLFREADSDGHLRIVGGESQGLKHGLRLKPGARNGGKAHGRTRQKRVLNHDANIDRLTDGACTTARDAFGFCLIDRKDQRDGSRMHEVLPRSGSRAVITLGKKLESIGFGAIGPHPFGRKRNIRLRGCREPKARCVGRRRRFVRRRPTAASKEAADQEIDLKIHGGCGGVPTPAKKALSFPPAAAAQWSSAYLNSKEFFVRKSGSAKENSVGLRAEMPTEDNPFFEIVMTPEDFF